MLMLRGRELVLVRSPIRYLHDEDGAQSHFLRMSVVSHLLESLDLNKKEDVAADLQKNKKRKNAEALKSICQHIENTINPFSTDVDPNCLLNIETGRAANEETVAFYSMCRKQEMHTERSS